MRFKYIFSLILISFIKLFYSQPPNIEWQKSFGGTGQDGSFDLQLTSDGGYISAGISYSSPSGNITISKGGGDVWLVKTDALGNIQWQKSYGGSNSETLTSIKQTSDGGYIFTGSTRSVDGDITNPKGNEDVWVVKLDQTGNIQWQKNYGGTNPDYGKSVEQTTDGGYIIAAATQSTNGDVAFHYGNSGDDFWLLKLDSMGNLQWQKTFGGNNQDLVYKVKQTPDLGYVLAGATTSPDGNVTNPNGTQDSWVVKTDQYGNLQWQKTYGGTSYEHIFDIKLTPDGGYITVGNTTSQNGDITTFYGNTDFWVTKLDSVGNLQWQKSFGGSGLDTATFVENTPDGGYIVGGHTESADGNVTFLRGIFDAWLIKLDASGNMEWQKTYGSSGLDYAHSLKVTPDGSYILLGTNSTNDYDVTGNHGSWDYWLVKFAAKEEQLNTQENSIKNNISIYPNPAKDFVMIDHLPNETTISIHDISGRKIFSNKYSETKVSINTSKFTNGTYIIQVDDHEKIILAEKLIIKK
jgi:hypothetical protein